MDREDFIQSSVRIRYAEKKLLTKQQLQRLADTKSLEDAIKLLNETSYSSEISKLDRPENYEEVLSDVLNKTYRDVTEISPDKSLVEILSCKYDYHNLKVLVKEHILKEKFSIDNLNEESFKKYLYTKENSDVDLMIRTGNEKRISNFLIYQLAYSEFYFTDILWPEFYADDLYDAIYDFQNRNRRFGGI